jgi:hypothetical protein
MKEEFYVQVIKHGTSEVEKEMGPFGLRNAEKVERGIHINLNYEKYYVMVIHENDR